MTAPEFRRYIPPILIAGLIVAALVWATTTSTPSEGERVATLETVRKEGVIYLEEHGVYLVRRGRGVLALTDDSQHLGDKVEWCPSSQLFESPAHGEKFDRFGRYFGGPAATDMDRVQVFAGTRGVFLNSPPIIYEAESRSRDAFEPEGPFCVGS